MKKIPECSPEDLAKASRIALTSVANRGEDWLVVLLSTIGGGVIDIVNGDAPVMHGKFCVGDVTINFDFYTHETELSKMVANATNFVMDQANMDKPQ